MSTVKNTIQQAYRQFLQNQSLKPRLGQKQMIADIANTLLGIHTDDEGVRDGEQHIAVLEAGTGTGKTVAYLLAALPIAKALDKKIVISTATVALQEQIIHKDLPAVKQHTSLDFSYLLAKGRGRYLCLSKLDRLLSEETGLFTSGLYADETPLVDEQNLSIYQTMAEALSQGQWNGDRDSWPSSLEPQQWAPVSTTHRECTGRHCAHVSRCHFFKAREAMNSAHCTVANHDLVLSDLALGGGAILPPPKETIYIFDEGHHLPEKALQHFAYHVRIQSTSKWLEQMQKNLNDWLAVVGGNGKIDCYAETLPALFGAAKQQLDHIYPDCQAYLQQAAQTASNADDKLRYRFENGVVDLSLANGAEQLYHSFSELERQLGKLVAEMQSLAEVHNSHLARTEVEACLSSVVNWHHRVQANHQLWLSYQQASEPANGIPLARWLTLVEAGDNVDVEICSSPILAAPLLKQSLWDTCFAAVVTSATLSALGSFQRFIMRAGTAPHHRYGIMPSPFDFSKASLHVPGFVVEANQVQAHTDMLIEQLPALLEKHSGSLVLFASRKQMQAVFDELPDLWRRRILMQGVHSKQQMLGEHKQAIDEGKKSVLFGLASFAEGVDLPGDYCAHVIIAKIPFAVPDDPVESALAEWISAQGGNAFMQITVPDASIKLVQACGRLLRTEQDSGTITLLDKRITSKRYGKSLLGALPTYRLLLEG